MEQQQLVDKLNMFFAAKSTNREERIFLLTGIPGSGKTTTIAKYITNKCNTENLRKTVAFLAPTHKARQILKKKLNNKFECMTIAKYLNYSLDIDAFGRKRYISDPKNPCNNEYKILIIDECSMVNKRQYEQILKKNWNFMIMLGDPNQLPPINETISPCFSIPAKYKFQLTDNHRSNQEITETCNYILQERTIVVPQNEATIYTDSVEYLLHLQEYSVDDHDKFKILCWTNNRCRQMNQLIREFLYGSECERFCHDELLIAKDHFTIKDKTYTSNEEIKITHIEKQNKTILKDYIPKAYLNPLDKEYVRCWQLTTNKNEILLVVHKRYEKIIDKVLEKIKATATQYVKNNELRQAKVLWKLYYSIHDRFMPPIDYYYAITIHRSQGSEWNDIYIEYSDVVKNRNKDERVKLFYVACSRASNRIIVHKD